MARPHLFHVKLHFATNSITPLTFLPNQASLSYHHRSHLAHRTSHLHHNRFTTPKPPSQIANISITALWLLQTCTVELDAITLHDVAAKVDALAASNKLVAT
ncbi:pentatricopeptide repeat-containing protein [Sesbania bispinosa]|nr:pentatricopeptide repeat-containing protein [Sesbania bispinosa]